MDKIYFINQLNKIICSKPVFKQMKLGEVSSMHIPRKKPCTYVSPFSEQPSIYDPIPNLENVFIEGEIVAVNRAKEGTVYLAVSPSPLYRTALNEFQIEGITNTMIGIAKGHNHSETPDKHNL